jgi:hypothetical protein
MATVALCAILLVTPTLAVTPAEGRGEHFDVWRSLRYGGRSWLARFTAELTMEVPEDAVSPWAGGEALWVAELRTRLDSALLTDKSSRFRAHFDPIRGVVRRLSQLSMGASPDLKRYEFGPGGVTRLRSEPAAGQSLDRPETWPSSPESDHAYDPDALGCRLVSTPSALAWWLTWGPGAASETFEDPYACYFLGKTLYRVSIQPLGSGVERVDYRVVREGRSVRRSGRVPVERFEAVVRPIAGKLDEKTIVAEIALDAANRLPLRFEMREGPFGIDVELEDAVLGAPSMVGM